MYNYAENALNVFQNRDRMRLEAQKAQAKANQQAGRAQDNALGQAMQMMQMQQMINDATEKTQQMRVQMQKQHLNNIGRAMAMRDIAIQKMAKAKDPNEIAKYRAEISRVQADINIYTKKNKDYFPEEYAQMSEEATRLEQESMPLRAVDDWNDDEVRLAKTFLNNRLNGKNINFSNNYTESEDWINIKRTQGGMLDKKERITYTDNPRPARKALSQTTQQEQQEQPQAMSNRLDAGIDIVLNAPEAGDGPVSKMSAEDTAKFKQSQQQPQQQPQQPPQQQPDLANLTDEDLYKIMRGDTDYLGLDDTQKLELIKAVEALKLGRVHNGGLYDTENIARLLSADSINEYTSSYSKILSQDEIAADRFAKESAASNAAYNGLYAELGYSDAEASLKADERMHGALDADLDIQNKQQAIREKNFNTAMNAKPGSRDQNNMLQSAFMGQTDEKGQATLGGYTNPVVSSGSNSEASKVYTGTTPAISKALENFSKSKQLTNKDGSHLTLKNADELFKARADGVLSDKDYEEFLNSSITYNSVKDGKTITTTVRDAMNSGLNKLSKDLRNIDTQLGAIAKAMATKDISTADAIIGQVLGAGITGNFITDDQRYAALMSGQIYTSIISGSKKDGNTYISGGNLTKMAGLFTNGQNTDTTLKVILDSLDIQKQKLLSSSYDSDFGIEYAAKGKALEIDKTMAEVRTLYDNIKAFKKDFPRANMSNTPRKNNNEASVAYDSKESTITIKYKDKMYTYKDGVQIKL